jgi:hypothetical protein
MDDLAVFIEGGYEERDGFLHACKVVVKAMTGLDEKRGCDAAEAEG